jgi:hypothetical protein
VALAQENINLKSANMEIYGKLQGSLKKTPEILQIKP